MVQHGTSPTACHLQRAVSQGEHAMQPVSPALRWSQDTGRGRSLLWQGETSLEVELLRTGF